MRVVVIAAIVASMMVPAFSQAEARGNKRGSGQKTEQPKKKTDDKDYKAALDRIPTQKYDPWQTVRPEQNKH
jgi:hypothetical protein